MLKSWDKYKNSEKLHRRIYKGIPLQLRGQVWSLILDVPKLKDEKKDLYTILKQKARNLSPDIRQIDLDVNRTFRDHIMFRDRYGVKQQALFHVLAAYSLYNTETQELYTSLYTMKWFFQCFLDRTPFTLNLRIWDIYVLEGDRVLTTMSYTILKLHKKYLMKLTMEDLIEFLQESLAKNFGYEDDYVIEQLQLSMTELRRAKLDLPPPGKDDEQPKKTLGLIPSEPAQILANHVMNGQKSTGKLPNQIKPEKVNSPSKAPQASPTEKRRKNSIDKSTLKSIKRESGEYRTEHFKTNGHNRKFPQPVTPTQDKVKYYDHAAANQNSNATSSSSKGIAPKWNLPSESKNKELLLKHMSDVRGNPPEYRVSGQTESRGLAVKQKNRVFDAGGKRGSNASQYDNVSGGENEIDNHIEDSRQQSDLSDKNVMYFNSTSSQIPFKGSSPSRTTESNSAFGMQPRSPGRSTPFQGTGDGYKQPPPSYSSPPLYQNNAKYSLSRLNSGHHSPTRIGQSNMSYDDSFDFPSDKIPMNSTGRQNPVTSPSNRIEVLPAEENATLRLGNFNQRENHRYIVIPPIDYQLDHTFVPEVSFGTFGQPLNREASRSYLSNLQKSPGSYQPSSPVTNFSSLSVNSPVRLRTSPHNEQVTPPRYLHSKPGAPHFRNHRDGLIMHESVML
ncbi:USP6 N-terminal-like protein isoform X4 [Ranitomeya imitator]